MLKVNEMFVSFQGEAHTVGMPMIFIRFSGCNLNCSFCDTEFSKFIEITPSKIISIIKEKNNERANLVSITGGEPLMQDGDSLLSLMNAIYWDCGYKIILETNATLPKKLNKLLLDSNYELPDYIYTINADLKTEPNGEFMHGTEESHLEFFRIMARYFQNNTLKIVITPEMVNTNFQNEKNEGLYNSINKTLSFFSGKTLNISLTPITVNGKTTQFKIDDLFNIYDQVKNAAHNNSVTADIRIIPQMHVLMNIQ